MGTAFRALLLLVLVTTVSHARDEVSDIFGDLGTARAIEDPSQEDARRVSEEGRGAISGLVIDAETGAPIANATVIVSWTTRPRESQPQQEVAVTVADGSFEFPSIPSGLYDISFVKSGYRTSAMKGFRVESGRENQADFPLPPLATASTADVMQLDAFVVEASAVDDMLTAVELRLDSDVQLNIMSAADFSKYASNDVADALRRVAGVSIVEGQFAIIRGLEDRYSSTLYNSAPIPSPDPNSQSVQLDLFPSEILSNLMVAKSFAPDQPGNSSGGSINIITHEYPQELSVVMFKGALEANTNALDRFLLFQPGSPMGQEIGGKEILAGDFGASIGGRTDLARREIRYKAVFNWESDYRTALGQQSSLEPRIAEIRRGRVIRPGDLALGLLSLTDGRFDLTTSRFVEQGTGYLGLGFDLDERARHKIDASVFYTRKRGQIVRLEKNGFLPFFDYGPVVAAEKDDESIGYSNFQQRATLGSWIAGARAVREFREEAPSRGPVWFSNFNESRSFERARDLLVAQVNGDHEIGFMHGLRVSWAANYAQTSQDEIARGARYFFEPDDIDNIPERFPVRAADLGAGQFAVNDGILFSSIDVEERQGFGRLDVEYEHDFADWFSMTLAMGGWFEHATRDVASSFLENPTVRGSSQFAILADTPQQLGYTIFQTLDRTAGNSISGLRETTNEGKRQIGSWSFSAKTTFWDDLDLLAGWRLESLLLESINRPYTGELQFGAPSTYPTAYLFFDRLDNPGRGEVIRPPPPGTTFNDQLLGLVVPADSQTGYVDLLSISSIDSLVNGRIDERRILPAAGVTYRPLEGMAMRASYSMTVARPSFREMGFYVSVEPGSDDLIVGNPQLGLSDVQSIDGRVEYAWGQLGDLVAMSAFFKTIDDPIESTVIRSPLDLEQSSGSLYRTFFNNPNRADLWGIEVEARKALDFLGVDFMEALSIGGNFTYIDAQVDRVVHEVDRVEPFFAVGDRVIPAFPGLASSRRLFGQPEWIANADLTLDYEKWGTQITLAFFAISDVLDAAGSVLIRPNGDVVAYTPDRYVQGYQKLDLIISQRFHANLLHGDIILKATLKNLTDSTRALVYDPAQTQFEYPERQVKLGRTFKLEIKYEF